MGKGEAPGVHVRACMCLVSVSHLSCSSHIYQVAHVEGHLIGRMFYCVACARLVSYNAVNSPRTGSNELVFAYQIRAGMHSHVCFHVPWPVRCRSDFGHRCTVEGALTAPVDVNPLPPPGWTDFSRSGKSAAEFAQEPSQFARMAPGPSTRRGRLAPPTPRIWLTAVGDVYPVAHFPTPC